MMNKMKIVNEKLKQTFLFSPLEALLKKGRGEISLERCRRPKPTSIANYFYRLCRTNGNKKSH